MYEKNQQGGKLERCAYGAIKRIHNDSNQAMSGNFNSCMVRLKVFQQSVFDLFFQISIPVWCD